MKKLAFAYTYVMILVSWTAVLLQLVLLIVNREQSLSESLMRFFSYFTILSNIVVMLSFTLPKLSPKSAIGKFFIKPRTKTAVTVYIVIVGIVYNIVLRNLWAPKGLQLLADNLLHNAVPILSFLYWLLFVPKSQLKWTNAFPWLLYPLIYCISILFRGSLSGFYPYPFVNVEKLGYPMVLLNCVVLAGGFLMMSFFLLGLARIMSRMGLK